MKFYSSLAILLLLLSTNIVYSQFVYKIKADSLLVTNDSCNAEFNLENSTRNVKGFLYNKGNGRTEFRRGLIKLNDTVYLIGGDTLKVGVASGLNYILNQTIQQSNANFNIDGTGTLSKILINGASNSPLINLKLASSASVTTPIVSLRDALDTTLLEIRSYYRVIDSSANLFIGTGSGANVAFTWAYAGINNTAVGYKALAASTSGSWNTAMGRAALTALQTGNFNTAYGEKAMYSFVSGDDNTAIGQAAMFLKTSGNYNVALGSNVLESNFTGSENTALGRDAGRSNNGSQNVFIGRASGNFNYGSGNVFIGYNSGSNSGNISNKLFIHNGTTNTPLIYGDFDSLDIKVNGRLSVSNLSTSLVPPVTIGTTKMVITDANGKLSFADISSSAGYSTIQEGGSALTQQATANFGYGVTAVNNSSSNRTDIDIDLSNVESFLSSDVTLTTNTFSDAVSISLGAGTWAISGSITVESPNNSAQQVTYKLWDGATVYQAGESSSNAMGASTKGYTSLPVSSIIVLTGTTSVKVSVASTVASVIKATPADNNTGTTNKATSFRAVRIK